jgi:Acetyltransferase (GNAT) domain
MSDYSIHKLGKTEFELLIPLMKDCFGMETNLKYFEWKFKDNPSGFVEGFYAKDASGEIAAYYGVIPELYIINKEQRLIYQSCDTMTHSKHRRKGLFQKLALHCYESLKNENKLFVVGFGGGQSTPGFLKFGWREIFKVKYYFYPKQFKLFNSGKFSDIEEIIDFTLIEHLTIKSNEFAKIHSYKSAKIYAWRVSNPLNNYKTIAIKSGDEAYNSYLSYYEENDKIILFDFYFGNDKSGKMLFNYLKSLISKNQKGIISFVQENSKYSNTLASFKFISNPFKKGPLCEKTPFIFFALPKELDELNESSSWQINAFDHDAI